MAMAQCIPPATEAASSVTCKDVVMGRGSGTQNHCGNVAYRKLVYLNKELYATSSKFEKQKIAKAIVAAVRYFGGGFLQAMSSAADSSMTLVISVRGTRPVRHYARGRRRYGNS